jgi:hypothetical protein
MMSCLAVGTLLLSPLTFAHEDAIVAASYDELWRRTSQSLLIMGFTITARDKDAGVINAEITTGAQAGWFTECPRGRGEPDLYGFSVSILLNVLNEDSTGIRVAAKGLNTWKQVDHYGPFFRKRYIANAVHCTGTSNGEAEKLVLSHITGIRS